jgi:hypothetical protein
MVKYSSRLGDIPPLSAGNSRCRQGELLGWVAGHFAEGHFAERHFTERHFAERTF